MMTDVPFKFRHEQMVNGLNCFAYIGFVIVDLRLLIEQFA